MPQQLEAEGRIPPARPGDRSYPCAARPRLAWLGAAAFVLGLASSPPISAQTRGSLQARARVVAAGSSAGALEAGRRLAAAAVPRTLVVGLARIGPLPGAPGAVARRRIIRIDFLRN